MTKKWEKSAESWIKFVVTKSSIFCNNRENIHPLSFFSLSQPSENIGWKRHNKGLTCYLQTTVERYNHLPINVGLFNIAWPIQKFKIRKLNSWVLNVKSLKWAQIQLELLLSIQKVNFSLRFLLILSHTILRYWLVPPEFVCRGLKLKITIRTVCIGYSDWILEIKTR